MAAAQTEKSHPKALDQIYPRRVFQMMRIARKKKKQQMQANVILHRPPYKQSKQLAKLGEESH